MSIASQKRLNGDAAFRDYVTHRPGAAQSLAGPGGQPW